MARLAPLLALLLAACGQTGPLYPPPQPAAAPEAAPPESPERPAEPLPADPVPDGGIPAP